MSITENMTLSTVHSHIACLGWTSLTLCGVVYHLFPGLSERVICKILFWLFNIGLPIMIIGVSLYFYTETGLVKAIISIGAVMVSIAVILFAVNVFMGMKK
jgi:cbb3-type cytochrome oxidase subunit 1